MPGGRLIQIVHVDWFLSLVFRFGDPFTLRGTFLKMEHLANFSPTLIGRAQDFDVQIPEALGNRNRLLFGASFHDRETAYDFLRLGKGAVAYSHFPARKLGPSRPSSSARVRLC